MKVTKVTKNTDYVRFSVNLELEREGLKVLADVTGGLIEETIAGIKVQFIEDPDVEVNFKLFGEEVDYLEFKGIYSKLFKKSFESFEKEIKTLCIDEVNSVYTHSLVNLSHMAKIAILEEMMKKSKVVTSHNDIEYYTNVHNVYEIIHTIATYDGIVPTIFKVDGRKRNYYGMKCNELNEALKHIKDL